MILLFHKFIFVLLVSKTNAVLKNTQALNPKQVKYFQTVYENFDENGLLKKISGIKKHPEFNSNVLSNWKVEPSKTSTFSYFGFKQREDNRFQLHDPLQYVEEDEFSYENTIRRETISSSFTKSNKMCPPLKNDIAALFDKNAINVSLENSATKKQSSEVMSSSEYTTCETVSQTETKTNLISCSTIKKISSPLFFKFTCSKNPTNHKKHKKSKKKKNSSTPKITNNMFQHVSQESMVNMVIHVHCGQTDGKTHIIQQIPIFTSPVTVQNVYITPNVLTKAPHYTYQSYTKTFDNQVSSWLPANVKSWSQEVGEGFDRPMSKKKLGTVALDTRVKLPKPFLPQDVKLKCTTPPPVIKQIRPTTTDNTFKAPLFLCQVNNHSCKASKCKLPETTKQMSPTFHLWKHFSLPRIKLKKTTPELNSKSVSLKFATEKIPEEITPYLDEDETTSPLTKLQRTRPSIGDEGLDSGQQIFGSQAPETTCQLKTTRISESGTSGTESGDLNEKTEEECEDEEVGDEEEEEEEECDLKTQTIISSTKYTQSSESVVRTEPWTGTIGKMETWFVSNQKRPKEGMGTNMLETFTLSSKETEMSPLSTQPSYEDSGGSSTGETTKNSENLNKEVSPTSSTISKNKDSPPERSTESSQSSSQSEVSGSSSTVKNTEVSENLKKQMSTMSSSEASYPQHLPRWSTESSQSSNNEVSGSTPVENTETTENLKKEMSSISSTISKNEASPPHRFTERSTESTQSTQSEVSGSSSTVENTEVSENISSMISNSEASSPRHLLELSTESSQSSQSEVSGSSSTVENTEVSENLKKQLTPTSLTLFYSKVTPPQRLPGWSKDISQPGSIEVSGRSTPVETTETSESLKNDMSSISSTISNSETSPTKNLSQVNPPTTSMTTQQSNLSSSSGEASTYNTLPPRVENGTELQKVNEVIDLGGNYYQFYFKTRWYITDKKYIWSFENHTNDALNESFFKTYNGHDTNISEHRKVIGNLLISNAFSNSSKDIPFNIFIQSILLTSKYSSISITLNWSGLNLTYEDIIAILRYTDFDKLNSSKLFYEWNSINWRDIYQKVIDSQKTKRPDRCEYFITGDNKSETNVVVYSNGSSEMNGKKLNLDEVLEILQHLNSYTTSQEGSLTVMSTKQSEKEDSESTEISSIIYLGGNNYQFYLHNRWYVTDKQHVWLFDNYTSSVMNESFHKVSKENVAANNVKNRETLQTVLKNNSSNNFSEQMPFELFGQSILKTAIYIPLNISLVWGNISLNYTDIIGMLRLSEFNVFDSLKFGYEWGETRWDYVLHRLKQSDIKTFADRYEYNITDSTGTNNFMKMVVYFNGSSIWMNKKLDLQESIVDLQHLNSNTKFSGKTLNSSYISNSSLFTTFVKNVFEQKSQSKTTYTNYRFKNQNINYDEILALLTLLNVTLNGIETFTASLEEYELEKYLKQIRSSKTQYYSDRIVYYITDGPKLKPITVFTNGTTEFNNMRSTLEDMSRKLKEVPSHDMPTTVSNEVQHLIHIGGEKYQFYWKGKWYITDQRHVWPFEDETSKLMNDTFFSVTEDKTVKKESIDKILKSVMNQNTHIQQEMPFELFSQSFLIARNFTQPKVQYKWANHSLNYEDMLAMMRVSNFSTHSLMPKGQWGETNWQIVYQKVKDAPESVSYERHEYNVSDFDGSNHTLVVFNNGTSIWRNEKLDASEDLTVVEELNNKSEFPKTVINSPYISKNETFERFVTEVAENERNNITHNSYVWFDLSFTRYEVLGIIRLMMQGYQAIAQGTTNADSIALSFSGIVFPLLKSKRDYSLNSVVFNINYNSQIRRLIVYNNGTTQYHHWKQLSLDDTINELEAARNVVGFIFREDKEVFISHTAVSVQTHDEDEVEYEHHYDWKNMSFTTLEVYYPFSIGSGFVEFFFNKTWYITDGYNMWNLLGVSSQYWNVLELSQNFMQEINQTFAVNPKLTKTVIQNLIDEKMSKRPDELVIDDSFTGILIPFEIMIQHVLFFWSKLVNVPTGLSSYFSYPYFFQKTVLKPPDVLVCLLMAVFDPKIRGIPEEFSWNKTRKFHWEWLVKVERMARWHFTNGRADFQFKPGEVTWPQIIVYENLTIVCDDQILNGHKLLKKVKLVNKKLDTSVVEMKKEFKSDSDFDSFGKLIMKYRLQNEIYMKYKWYGFTFNWYQFLAILRASDPFTNNTANDWVKVAFKATSQFGSQKNFVEGFKINIENESLSVYMNETTDFRGEMITDIKKYLRYFPSY